MLYHTGHKRTFQHNIRLAALLCLTAGIVNVAGFIGFGVLTTNVTGHVALFADNLSQTNFALAWRAGFWMLMFFLGAFASSLWLKLTGHNKRFAYTIPILVEITILLLVGYRADLNQSQHTPHDIQLLAGSLLFAMGLQNALVSMISGAVVRTTHLTGIFTDFAIDLSALFVSERAIRSNVRRKVLLKFVIILFFFLGGILGGFLFRTLKYHTFFIPACILFIIMIYDMVRIRTQKMIIRIRHATHAETHH